MANASRRQNWAKEDAEKIKQETVDETGKLKMEEPAPTQPAPAQPAPAQPAPAQPAPAQPAQPAPAQPAPAQPDPIMQAELQQARLKLAEERALREAERAEREKALAELAEIRRQKEIAAAINLEGRELPNQSIDPEDAKTLLQWGQEATLKTIQARDELREKEIAELKKQLAQQTTAAQEFAAKERTVKTDNAILAALPNFRDLMKSPQLLAAMARPVRPGSDITEGALVEQAYHKGNAQYVIDFVTNELNNRPQFDNIAQVSPTNTGNTTTPTVDEESDPDEDEQASWLEQVKTGRMSRKTFQEKRKALQGRA